MAGARDAPLHFAYHLSEIESEASHHSGEDRAMVSRFGKALALGLAALAFSAGQARAQSWAVTAYLGYYFPLGDVLSEEDVGENVSQQSTVAFGGRISRM